MASIGSYILSTQQRTKEEPDPQLAAGQILKLIGQKQPRPLMDLVSVTSWSHDYVKTIVDQLRQQELVTGNDEALELTNSGFKAQFIVAA
jgi:hypothetical protein